MQYKFTHKSIIWILALCLGIAIISLAPWLKEKYEIQKRKAEKEAYAKWIDAHEYTKRPKKTPEEWKKLLDKQDRPDLAAEQRFFEIVNPDLGYIPKDDFINALRETQLRLTPDLKTAIAGLDWNERGPDNVGGRTRAIMFDPNDATNKKVWAGGVSGGLWYTNDITNADSSWYNIDDFWNVLAIGSIAYDPSNTNTFYVGTGEGFFNADAVRGAGIWKTTDGGATWAQLPSTDNVNFHYVQKIVVTATGDVIAATRSGIRRSTDGGANWTLVLGGNGQDLETAANGDIYASVRNPSGTIHKSTDNGITWTDISPPTGTAQRIELATAPSNANVVYAISANGGNIGYFKKTTNGGTTWTDITIPMYLNQSCAISATDDFARGQAWFDLILGVKPTDENIIVAGAIDLYRSTDGGTTWGTGQPISYWTGGCGKPYVHADQHAMVFRPGSPNEMIFGHDGGVSYSANVADATATPAFTTRVKGYNVTQFYACAVRNEVDNNYFLAGSQDNGTQRFNGPGTGIVSTTMATGGDGGFCFIDQDDPTYQLTSYIFNYWRRSTNAGATFNNISASNTGRFINPADYDNDTDILYAAGDANRIFRVAGVSATLDIQTINVTIGNRMAASITASPYTDNRIFVGTDNGRIFRIDNAHTATPTSTEIDPSTTLPNGYIRCIAIGEDDNHLMITYSNYGVNSVWETQDGGNNWVSKEGNLPNLPINWALYNPENYNQVILATETGIWSTNDVSIASPNWQPSSIGLANVRCSMLKYRQADKMVVVATHGRGLFTSDVFRTPVASFTANPRITYIDKNITFTDVSVQATTWNWNFGAGATPATATGAGPHTVAYSTAGLKTISLTINSGLAGEDTQVQTDYIHVLPDRTTTYNIDDGGNFEINTLDFASQSLAGTPFERGNSAIAGKNGTTSGANAWVTGITNPTYVNNSESYLLTPNFDFAGAGTYTLEFELNSDLETNWDGMIVEYTLNKGDTWTQLGAAVAPPDWYNGSKSAGTSGFPNATPMFTNNTGGYQTRTFDVSAFEGEDDVAFRFHFRSDNTITWAGIAIDDFRIIYNPTTVTADFTAATTTICEGNTITYTDNSTGATDWNWSFPGGTPATATGIGPHVITYNTAGTYDAVLSINASADTETKVDFVTVNPVATVTLAASSTTICAGDNVDFTATASSTGNFEFFVNGTSVQDGASHTYSSTSLNNGDSLAVTFTNTCGAETSTPITMTVNPAPLASLSASTTEICDGDNITFTATPTGATNYEFFVNGTSVQTGTSDTYSTTTLADGETVTVAVTNSCGTNTSTGITINVSTTAIATISASDTEICADENVTFTATPAGATNYEFFVNGTSVQTGTSDTYSTTTLEDGETITVTTTTTCGTATSTGITMTVNTAPATGLTASATTICTGDNVIFTATPAGATNYEFFVNGTSVQTGTSSTYSTNALTDSEVVTVSATTACGITTSTGITMSVNDAPTATLTSTATDICEGENIAFNATPLGATNYEFFVNGTLAQDGISSSFNTTTLNDGDAVSVAITTACGYDASTAITVSVDTDCTPPTGGGTTGGGGTTTDVEPVQNFQAVAQNTTSILLTWRVSINAEAYGLYRQAEGSSEWVSLGSFSAGVREQLDEGLTPDTRYRYRLDARLGTAAASSFATEYTYPEAPNLSLIQPACEGNPIAQIGVETTHRSERVRWYETQTSTPHFAETVGTYRTPPISETTTYYATSMGQKYESQPRVAITLSLVARPQASFSSFSNDNRFLFSCNEEARLEVEDQGSGTTYRWLHNGRLIAETSEPNLIVDNEGTYVVVVRKGGCDATSDNLFVKLTYRPTAQITGRDFRFCESGVLRAVEVPNATYEWFKDGTSIAISDINSIEISESGSYQVKVSQYACDSLSASIQAEVLPLPTAISLEVSNAMLCPGENVILTTTEVPGANYYWTRNGRPIGFSQTNTLIREGGGEYKVRVSYPGFNCFRESEMAQVVVLDMPIARVLKDGRELVLTLEREEPIATIDWYYEFEGVREPLPDYANAMRIVPTRGTGFYGAELIYQNGCAMSAVANRYFDDNDGITGEEAKGNFEVGLYPNPASSTIKLSNLDKVFAQSALTIEIYDALGRKVLSHSLSQNNIAASLSLNISHLAKGTYTLHLQSEQQTLTKKWVKE
ncbi:MAG: T9SS type A sorting domain-containing protein [Bernardetiaceae bacterium]|nr:T9SS type A sorting domain-containing protein [Bernardetiaceae bacterium]